MNGNLTSACSENKALDLDNIADIPLFELGKLILADIVHSDIYLHTSCAVGDINKVGLAHVSPGHDTSAKSYVLNSDLLRSLILGKLVCLCFKLLEGGCNFRTGCRLLCSRYLKRVLACLPKRNKLVNPDLSEFVSVLLSFNNRSILFFCHI